MSYVIHSLCKKLEEQYAKLQVPSYLRRNSYYKEQSVLYNLISNTAGAVPSLQCLPNEDDTFRQWFLVSFGATLLYTVEDQKLRNPSVLHNGEEIKLKAGIQKLVCAPDVSEAWKLYSSKEGAAFWKTISSELPIVGYEDIFVLESVLEDEIFPRIKRGGFETAVQRESERR